MFLLILHQLFWAVDLNGDVNIVRYTAGPVLSLSMWESRLKKPLQVVLCNSKINQYITLRSSCQTITPSSSEIKVVIRLATENQHLQKAPYISAESEHT